MPDIVQQTVSEPLTLSLKEKILSLQNALLAQNPGYKDILSLVQKETAGHPEYVFAMTDEEIFIVFQGYEKWTGHTLEVKGKKEAVSRKQGALLSSDDI